MRALFWSRCQKKFRRFTVLLDKVNSTWFVRPDFAGSRLDCRHNRFFYPVLTEPYATQIARDWNTKDESSGFVGCVLRFMVRSEFLKRYEIHIVGSAEHREYWIPRGDLEALNDNIVGNIEVISEFRRET